MSETLPKAITGKTRSMTRVGELWAWLADKIRGFRVQLRLCVRVSLAAILTYVISQALHLPLPLWAVLTSVIVTQMSVGKSVKATIDYMIGTLGGAIYSGAIGAFFPHAGPIATVVMLVIAIAPLALLSASSSRFSAAPFTAVMVILFPAHVSPLYSAFYRVIEVALGCGVSLVVSVFVFPERAHNLVIDSAARMLDLMAGVLPRLTAGLTETQDQTEITRVQDRVGAAFIQLNGTAAEAKRERLAYFNVDGDPQSLVDTLLRLRHDLVMLGRASLRPLPQAFVERLGRPISELSRSAADYLRASGAALQKRGEAPSLVRFEAALKSYTETFATARRDGLTRELSADSAERIFALGFALEQLHQNFAALRHCTAQTVRLRQDASMSKA